MCLIFAIDRETHYLPPDERLNELKISALPILERILANVESLIKAKEATPSSDMGTALSYFKKHYETLKVPYEIPGVGLTNNLSEWMTYPVVRYLNNCRHYATQEGADIGDYVHSLTMLALLSGRNPVAYIEYLLANQAEFENQPSAMLFPWDLSLEKLPELEQNWLTNWIPKPGDPQPSAQNNSTQHASVS